MTLLAVAGDAFVPAVAALTLGLAPRTALARRLGRNSAFDHAGNIATALVAGVVGTARTQRAVFLLVPVYAALTSAAVLAIPARRSTTTGRATSATATAAAQEGRHLAWRSSSAAARS